MRRTYYDSIQYAAKGDEERILKGTVCNISLSGMGMYASKPLMEGQEIVVRSYLPGSHLFYTVRWTENLMDDFYMVGLKMEE